MNPVVRQATTPTDVAGHRRLAAALLRPLCLLCALFCLSAYAITVGPPPGPKTPKTTQAEKPLPDPLNLVPLDAAVVVLDPGFSETDPKLDEKGIWPELRHSESIRSAIKIREALIAINQFESVAVVPDLYSSADMYLIGKIEQSTGEVLRISYRLIDATNKTWLNRADSHRVPVDWHRRFGATGEDPFQPLYDTIGNNVWKVLKSLAEDHTKTAKSNRSRTRRNKNAKLSKIETVATVRDLAYARHFSPEVYADALSQSPQTDFYSVNYLPDRNSDDWVSIQKIQVRDRAFVGKVNEHYDQFFEDVNPLYSEWQEETLPIANEIRLAKRRERAAKIAAGVLAVATVAAAVDADTTSARDTALAVGGALTSAALIKGMVDARKKKAGLERFNELSESYHGSFTTMRVEVGDRVVALEGTAAEQFNQWRELLMELHEHETTDVESVVIVQ